MTTKRPVKVKCGQYVRHSKFGWGTVMETRGDSTMIYFKNVGIKRLASSTSYAIVAGGSPKKKTPLEPQENITRMEAGDGGSSALASGMQFLGQDNSSQSRGNLMPKPGQTFKKRQRENKLREKAQMKRERRQQRRSDRKLDAQNRAAGAVEVQVESDEMNPDQPQVDNFN